MEKTKLKAFFKTKMFNYGILSVLLVLQQFEREEKFELCQIIIDSIREKEEYLGLKLFTVINQETINEVMNVYKYFGLTGEHAMVNSEYYADKIIKEYESNS
jgi:hypothetical protein